VKKNKNSKITPSELEEQARNESLPPHEDNDEKAERDAKISGYTDKDGHAVSMAKKDVPGHPTGAWTDIGAGRSSAVRPDSGRKTVENAPAVGEEQAP
jgi:hypothetical protein